MKTSIFTLLISSLLLLQLSCKKKNEAILENEIDVVSENTLIKYSGNNPEGLVATFIYFDKGITFSYYGTKSSSGEIISIEAASLYKSKSNDTILNFTFDSLKRVETFYSTINNKKDSIIIKFNYSDSFITLCAYSINWEKNTVTPRNSVSINKNNFNLSGELKFKVSQLEKDLVRLSTDAILFSVSIALFSAGPAVPVVLASIGACYGVYGLFLVGVDLYNFGKDKLAIVKNEINLFDAIYPSAHSSELDKPTTNIFVPVNPEINVQPIEDANTNNPKYSWTLVYVDFPNDPNTIPIHIDNMGFQYNGQYGVLDKVVWGKGKCLGSATDNAEGFYIWVKKGENVGVLVNERPCPFGQSYNISFTNIRG